MDCCGFIRQLRSNRDWFIQKRGELEHDRSAVSLSAMDQTSHSQTLLHLLRAEAPRRTSDETSLSWAALMVELDFFLGYI